MNKQFYRTQEVGNDWTILTPDGNVVVQGLADGESLTAVKVLNDFLNRNSK